MDELINLAGPIRDLELQIEGSSLEPIAREFFAELERNGVRKVRPRLYLSTEWGVPSETIAIAIPFYLAHPGLTALHARQTGHVEGRSAVDILRYLRHEMGHVVNYAYRLFATPEWETLFGSIDEPYREEYRPEPFSRDHVRHLPGWYAQKHPDEDWAETFAVWMTPGLDWRSDYADWPQALRKLLYCDEVMARLADVDPVVTAEDLDEDVSEIGYSLTDFYANLAAPSDAAPPGLDSALRAIFEDLGHPEPGLAPPSAERKLASGLIQSLRHDLASEIYRWTGHFPERTMPLLTLMADRADALNQVYPESDERRAIVALTTLVAALATNFVSREAYGRSRQEPTIEV